MTRKVQLWVLIFLSAATAAFQYMIQGTMATGGGPGDFTTTFWAADRALWGIRSLIESWIIAYLVTTMTKKWYQEILLLVCEIALLALLAFTLGPVFQALGAQISVYQLLESGNYSQWAYAIGMYTSLMIFGASIGYKIQPFDIKEEAMEPTVAREKDESIPRATDTAKKLVQETATAGKTSREEALPVVLEVIQSEEGAINQSELADQFNVSRQTVGNWLKFWQEKMVIAPLNGRGRFRVVEEVEMPEFGG